MPASTADSAMNSAFAPFATKRASVVLPVPGGPHRIIECGRPASSARRNGAPGPSRCDWPTYSSSIARSQPVGQRSIGTLARRGHLLSRPITSTPGGGEKVNRSGMSLGFLERVREGELRDLIELVREEHRRELAVLVEADAHQLEIRVRVLGEELEPAQPPLVRQRLDVELLGDRAGSRQEHGRCARRASHPCAAHWPAADPCRRTRSPAVAEHQLLRRARHNPSGICRAAADRTCPRRCAAPCPARPRWSA